MFIVKCTNCGREQEMKTGSVVGMSGEHDIEIAGTSIFCSCGHVIVEDQGVLREVKINVDHTQCE
jgi:phage terminase large subunit GpA-like protein